MGGTGQEAPSGAHPFVVLQPTFILVVAETPAFMHGEQAPPARMSGEGQTSGVQATAGLVQFPFVTVYPAEARGHTLRRGGERLGLGRHPNVLSRLPGLVAQVVLFLSQIHCCLGGMGQPWGPSSLVRDLH